MQKIERIEKMSFQETKRLIVFGVCLLLNTTAVAGVQWTQYQGDSTHSGRVSSSISPAELKPRWEMSSAQFGFLGFDSSVAADSQHVYVSAWDAQSSNRSQNLIALSLTNGEMSWKRVFDSEGIEPLSAPSVGNGMVYVYRAGDNLFQDHAQFGAPHLFGLNPANGEELFSTTHVSQGTHHRAVTVVDSQAFLPGGYYGGLDAFDAVSGNKEWFTQLEQQYGWIPAADDSRVYLYMGEREEEGALLGFDRSSGEQVLKIENPADVGSLYEGTVFLGTKGRAMAFVRELPDTALVGFDLESGNIAWRIRSTFEGMGSHIAVADGIVHLHHSRRLALYDEESGDEIGSWNAPAGERLSSNILVTDNAIFVSGSFATYAIDRLTLTTAWSTPVTGSLAFSSDTLLISDGSKISAFSVPEPSSIVLGGILTALVVVFRFRLAK